MRLVITPSHHLYICMQISLCRGGEKASDVPSEVPKEKRSKSELERREKSHRVHTSRDKNRTSGRHGDISHQDDRHHHVDDRHHHGDHRSNKVPHYRSRNSGSDAKTTGASRKEPAQPEKQDHWLSSNLIVKMADRTYKKGRHYNTKVFFFS